MNRQSRYNLRTSNVSPTPNAIDEGDNIPVSPSRQILQDDFRRNAERLLGIAENTTTHHVTRGKSPLRHHPKIEDFDLTRAESSFVDNAPDQVPIESDLEGHTKRFEFGSKQSQRIIQRRDVSPETAEGSFSSFVKQDVFLDEQSIEEEKHETQRQRIMILSQLVSLTIIIVTAVLVWAQISQEPKSLTPDNISTPTPTPSPSAGNNRAFDSIATFLTTFTSVDDQNFQDATKPQYQAISWMADIDTLDYSIPESSKVDGYFDFLQRYALVVLFYATNGDQWDDSSYFLQPTHACTWNYQALLTKDAVMNVGVTCNRRNEVTGLILPRNNLNGVLPTELKVLTALRLLDFSHNSIQGPIPSQFRELGHMQLFDLRHNELTGSIPAWIGASFPNLRELGLSFNNMAGTLPSSMNKMEKIKTLALAHNDFEASLAPIKNLSELEYLYLENNRFKDTVNNKFLINSTSLVQLDLSSNLLSGQGLPRHFFDYPKLKVLDLSDNQINGTIQDVRIRKHPLEFLSLSNNSLTGTFPTPIAYLRSLRHLDLTGNNLSGDIPSTLGSIQRLHYLFLSENNWKAGPIPTFLSEMSNLRELGLRATNRTGSLSSQWIGRLQLLELFDVSNNKLRGSIPSRLFENSHLHYVLLNRNEFDGELPIEDIGSDLRFLLLDKNKVTGNLTELCTGSNISIVADCVEDEIVCECCHCCADSDKMCNNYMWYMNEEFLWESNYKRTGYAYSPAILMPKTKRRHSQGIQVNHV